MINKKQIKGLMELMKEADDILLFVYKNDTGFGISKLVRTETVLSVLTLAEEFCKTKKKQIVDDFTEFWSSPEENKDKEMKAKYFG